MYPLLNHAAVQESAFFYLCCLFLPIVEPALLPNLMHYFYLRLATEIRNDLAGKRVEGVHHLRRRNML